MGLYYQRLVLQVLLQQGILASTIAATCATGLPEENMNTSEIIAYHGYPEEDHWVTTEDNFILSMQRIPHGRTNRFQIESVSRPVIFLQHGVIASSADWVSNSPNQSLAFLLADQGFDVWLGNVRGNSYSKNNTVLKPSQDAFWAWSWDEMARYDLPAMLGYVMNYTNQSDVFYVGHSQGTTMAFAGFSINQNLSSHIKAFFALAPVATVAHVKGLVPLLADVAPEILDFLKLFGVKEFAPSGLLTKFFAQAICGHQWAHCDDLIFLLCGFDTSNLNQTRLPVYLSHTPAGTSVRDVYHAVEEYKSGKFQMYDFGSPEANAEHYQGMTTPPLYNLTDFHVPVYTYAGSNDWIADPEDVYSLLPQLKSLKRSITIEGYNHLDFIWGINANEKLYEDIIQNAKSLL